MSGMGPAAAETSQVFQEARVLAIVGHQAEALALVDDVLRAVPGHLGALVLKSDLLRERRQDGEALEVAQQASSRWPRSASAHGAVARCLDSLGRGEEALASALEARRHLDGADPADAAPVFLTLVLCLRQARRYREALAAALEGHERTGDAVLAEWAGEIEQELAEAESDRC